MIPLLTTFLLDAFRIFFKVYSHGVAKNISNMHSLLCSSMQSKPCLVVKWTLNRLENDYFEYETQSG